MSQASEPDPLAAPSATARQHGLRHAPTTFRNRGPIQQALAQLLPARTCTVLEIASGSGEHALWMARAFPDVTWRTSEATADGLAAIEGWRQACPNLAARVPPPVLIDAASPPWPGPKVDVIFVANLTHISPWSATLGLFQGSSARLTPGGLLLVYGPFNEHGRFTSPGNADFDADLRARDPAWGLRNRQALDDAAMARGFSVEKRQGMPANNQLLVYRSGPEL